MPKLITTRTRIADLGKHPILVIGGLEVVKKGNRILVSDHDRVKGSENIFSIGDAALNVWMFVHLMSLVGLKNKVLDFFIRMFSHFPYDRRNRLIIGETKKN